ncbi:MAG: glycosyltransferase, partial [Pseudomonadota bacterium]
MVALIILFWAMVLIILYTYIGFPVMLWVRAKLSPQPFQSDTNHKPSVSFIVCAYNEEDVILDKVNNLIALDYPADKLEIIVASDGSSDKTNEIVKANPHPQVRLLELPRGGKNQTLNSAVAEAQSDVLVFTDADTLLKPDALTYLVAPFVDETVGGVSGDFHYRKSSAEGTESERTYWSIDRMLKQLQTDGGSMTSASGQ